MKKSVDIKVKGKIYNLMFNTKALAEAERSIGRSLVFMLELITTNPQMGNVVNIDFTTACLKAGLTEKPKNFDPYEFIDAYCEEGGTLNDLNGQIFEAIIASGLFTKGTAAETEKIIQKVRKLLAPA